MNEEELVFTGIVEELGEIVALEQRAGGAAVLRVRGSLVTSDARPGDSVAVNGVCVTVVEVTGDSARMFSADVMAETLARTGLGALVPGDAVNLERPLAVSARLGGHLVQGHVDATGTIVSRELAEHWETVRISLPAELARYVVHKGSIAVDGVSLTVVDAGTDSFSVALIPTTLERTTLGRKQPGDPVNLEVDVVAKYVERLVAGVPR